MKTIKVKDLIIGQGTPKIAASITGVTVEEIMEDIEKIDKKPIDIIEWRADFFEDIWDIKKTLELLKLLRKNLVNMPLIFTFRTKAEGGEKKIDLDYYTHLNKVVASSGDIDLIDIQVFLDKARVEENIKNIHRENIFVIGSNHDFLKTPPKEEMIDRLRFMDSLDIDLLKIAVMPKSSKDVLDLLWVTDQMKSFSKKPIITISMGKLGVISRICGGTFASSLTFGAIEKTSAPGQIPVEKLFDILDTIY